MPNAAPKSATVELELFRATINPTVQDAQSPNFGQLIPGSMVWFGFSQRQRKVRTDDTAWASVTQETDFIDAQGRVAIGGDVYERANVIQDGEVVGHGTWRYVGQMRDAAGRKALLDTYAWVNVGRETVPAAGQPMRNGLGLLLWDGVANAAIKRPASGEQDLDELGQPKVDGQGQPVLVP